MFIFFLFIKIIINNINNYEDNKKIIIGLLGKKRSGKDTSGNYLIEKYNFVKYAFADPVKEICRILFDFSDEQLFGNKKEGVDFRWYLTPEMLSKNRY